MAGDSEKTKLYTEKDKKENAVEYAFISYSSRDQMKADAARMLLKESGIPCWMAPYDIPAGSKYAFVINDALENCSCLLLLLSRESQRSQFVEKELERAIAYRKPIVTMQLEDLELNSGFKFYIGDGQIVAVHDIDPESPEMKRVMDGLRNFFKKPEAVFVSESDLTEEARAKAREIFSEEKVREKARLEAAKEMEEEKRAERRKKVQDSSKAVASAVGKTICWILSAAFFFLSCFLFIAGYAAIGVIFLAWAVLACPLITKKAGSIPALVFYIRYKKWIAAALVAALFAIIAFGY